MKSNKLKHIFVSFYLMKNWVTVIKVWLVHHMILRELNHPSTNHPSQNWIAKERKWKIEQYCIVWCIHHFLSSPFSFLSQLQNFFFSVPTPEFFFIIKTEIFFLKFTHVDHFANLQVFSFSNKKYFQTFW